MEPIAQEQPPKLRKIYDYLKSKQQVRPDGNYEEFEVKMQNPEKLQKVYDYLKGEKKVRSESFDVFQDRLGLKKKDDTGLQSDPLTQSILEKDPQSTVTPVPALADQSATPLDSGLTEDQEKQRNIQQLATSPIANENPPLPSVGQQMANVLQNPDGADQPDKKEGSFIDKIAGVWNNIKALQSQPANPKDQAPSPFINAIERGTISAKQADIINPFNGTKLSPEQIIKVADLQKDIKKLPSSSEYQEFNNSKTTVDALKALGKSPVKIISELTGESLSALAQYGAVRMAAGAAIGAGAGSVVPAVGTATGMGAGLLVGMADSSLGLEYSSKFVESLQEQGVDVSSADDLKRAFEDETIISNARSSALKKGIPIAIFDLISGGVAGKILTNPAKSIIGKIGQGAAEFGVQAGFGGTGELSGQLISGEDVNPSAIIAEMVGELGTTPIEVSNALLTFNRKINTQSPEATAGEKQTPVTDVKDETKGNEGQQSEVLTSQQAESTNETADDVRTDEAQPASTPIPDDTIIPQNDEINETGQPISVQVEQPTNISSEEGRDIPPIEQTQPTDQGVDNQDNQTALEDDSTRVRQSDEGNLQPETPEGIPQAPEAVSPGTGAETVQESGVQQDDSGGRKKSLLSRAHEGVNPDDVKKSIEKHGLTYEVESFAVSKERADEFINEVGIDNAIDAVRQNKVEDGAAAFIWASAIDQVNNKIAETTDETERNELIALETSLISEFDRKARSGGRFISSLQEVYRTSDFNFNAARQTENYKAVNNGTIPIEVEEKFKELENQLKDVSARLKKAEENSISQKDQDEFLKLRQEAEAKRAARRESATKRKEKINTFFDSLKITDTGGTANDITRVLGSAIWNGSVETMRLAVLAGSDVATVIQAGIDYARANYKGNDFDEKAFKEAVEAKIKTVVSDRESKMAPEMRDGVLHIPVSLIRSMVESGAQNINQVSYMIYERIKGSMPDISIRQVRDAITQYGKTRDLSKEELDVKIRGMKRMGKLISALEDVRNKMRPLKSGLQRDKLSDQERNLQKQIKEEMKGLPIDQAELDKEWKSALDAVKARLKNNITDLENQIKTGEKTPKKQGIQYDDEANQLKEKRDALRKIIQDIEGKPEMSDEQKVRVAMSAVERSIAEYERRITNKDFSKAKTSTTPQTSELVAAKKKRDDLKEVYRQLQNDLGETNQKRLAAAKKSTQKAIDEYERRIKEGDFTKRKKVPLIEDTELTKLRAEKQAIKEQFDKINYQNELKNRKLSEKILDGVVEAWGITRALRATGEFSFILLQGGIQTLAHPLNSAKALRQALTNFASEAKFDAWLSQIKTQEYYNRAKSSKLAISETDVKLTAREESFLGGWVNHLWDLLGFPLKYVNEAVYNVWKGLNPSKAVERAGVSYLNTVRILRYLEGEEMLRLQGKNFQDNADDYKHLADVINTFTGRSGLGAFERIAKPLSVVFFSPRNWASIIKQTTPYGLYWIAQKGSKGDPFYKPSVAQKIALADYMKYVGLTGGVVMLVAANGGDGEDDWKVELDPTSSDFMKLRKGNTRVDPWGGRVQMIVLQMRLILGTFKTNKGEVVKLGTPYKSDTKLGLIGRMVRNKLSPSASLLAKYLDSNTKTIRGVEITTDPYGNILDMDQQLIDNLYPIYIETIKEIHAEQPETLAYFLDFVAFLGLGTQTYKAQTPREKLYKLREIVNAEEKKK